MKFNGATFNKAQQDQLKKKVGAELEAVVEKVNDIEAHTTIKKYTVSDPTDIVQIKALAEFVRDNIGRINAIYGKLSSGSLTSLSYRVDSTNNPNLLLTSGLMLVGSTKELQIRQIEKIDNSLVNRWVSLVTQSDNSVVYDNNGNEKSKFTSIEVYYF